MITLYLCTEDTHVLERWAQIKNVLIERCNDLKMFNENNAGAIALIHLTERDDGQQDEIYNLIQYGVKVIALSNMPSASEGARLFKWGIKGYLNTFTDLPKIEQAIEVVKQDNVWLGQTVMSALIQKITQETPSTSIDWKEGLTERQLATANAILKGHTNREIAEKLSVSERTVKSYVQQLLERFDTRDRLGLVLKIHNWPNA